MDLSAILPLIMMKNNGANTDMANILMGMMSGKKQSESEILGQILKSQGGSPEMAAILQTAMKAQSERSATKKAEGFGPVLGFVNDDILGKMTKFFSANKRI